jgi:hypothetical protein
MPLYTCEHCDYSTKYKSDFTKHKKTNKHRLKLLELGISPEEEGVMNTNEHKKNTNEHKKNTEMNTNEHKKNTKTINCSFCDTLFNTKASRRRHEKHYCMENPDFVDKIITAKNSKIKTLQKDKERLENEKQELYKQVATLLDKVGDTTNIQNNIILNNYGKEDLSHITDALKTKMIGMPYGAIPKMIEAIHFNDEKPENKNIMIPNKKENLVKVFEGDKWIYKNKSETINDLVDSKYTIIDDHYEDMESQEGVEPRIKTTFTKFRKFYEEGDAEMVEKLRKECELVLLNNR